MGKILVLYHSLSGNTAKMAKLVGEGAGTVSGMEIRLREIADATPEDVVWCDGVACGCPTSMGIMSWQMKRFWDEPMHPYWMKVDGKIATAFSSSGGIAGGSEIACQSIMMVLINFGFLTFGVTDYVSKLMTLHYGAVAVREPREEETKAACRMLGQRLAEWVAVYVDGRADLHPNLRADRQKPG